MCEDIDILEDNIEECWPGVLDILLIDHTRHQYPNAFQSSNIVWATDSYARLGDEYAAEKPILKYLITKENGKIIQPRASKTKEEQTIRTKDKAEVFTPSWICNAQNNLIDNAWFGYGFINQFNTENPDNTWTSNPSPIKFPDGKTWKDYVRDTRLEITCGEAPYLCSRYDTVSGTIIPIKERIGLLDRKLRVVSENTDKSGDWLEWAKTALENTYGYEFQGDSLLIARETAFLTFIEYYHEKFGCDVPPQSINGIAYIVSWNIWQMDGLSDTVPYASITKQEDNLFGYTTKKEPVYALIRDWKKPREKQKTQFRELKKQK